MSEHTPGPWAVGKPGRGRFAVYASGKDHGRGVCVMSNTQTLSAWEVEKYGDHPLNIEADANAALIAAAPDLLRACNAALAYLDAEDSAGLVAEIAAAVAKAEGR